MIMNRLTMLAVTLIASMACFAQGKLTTGFPADGLKKGATFDHMGVKYQITVDPVEDQNVYYVEAIGFETNLLNDYSLMDKKPLENDLTIFHVKKPNASEGETGNSFVVLSVAANAFQTVDPDLAVKIERLIIEYSEDGLANNGVIALPSSGSTFAGLTGLTEVVSVIPGAKVGAISKTSFDANVYKTAPLVVPAENMGKYANKKGWKEFFILKDDGGKVLGDTNGDGDLNATDYTKLYNEIKKAIKNGTSVTYSTYKDLNGDGEVNATDYSLLYTIIKRNLNN